MYYWLVKAVFWLPVRIYFRFRVTGRDRIPSRGALLVVANHCSFLDPFILGSAFPRRIRFFVLRRMYELMRLCWFYVGMGTIPVGGKEGDRKAIRSALRILGRGKIIGIFPEGSRSGDGNLGMGKMGSAYLAAKSNVPIVPAYISGAFEAMPPRCWFPRPTRIQVAFGRPIRFDPVVGKQMNRDELSAISRSVQDSISSLREECSPAASISPGINP